MKTYFTSDLHFYHKNVLKFENRPFNTIEEMNEGLIEKWNNKVNEEDKVYILGDFSFARVTKTVEILKRLKGRKYLILGNHDSDKIYKSKTIRDEFELITNYYELKDENIVLFHYPIAVWNNMHHNSIHLFGHIHSNTSTLHQLKHIEDNSYNVGVDVNNYEPCTLEEIIENNKVWRENNE